MRSFVSAIAVLLVLGVTSVGSVSAQDANVAGTWTGTFSRSGITEDFTLVLKQDGQAATGTMTTKRQATGKASSKASGAESDEIAAKGTLDGKKLTLKAGRRTLEATISGDQMTGTVTGSGAPFNVVGARSK